MKLNDDGLCGIVDIPEDALAMLVELACCEQSRNVGADELDAMPPAGRGFGIVAHAANMAEWNVQLAFEGPQLVQSLHFKVQVIVIDGDFDHISVSIFEPLEIEADDGMIGDDSGKFPSVLPERIQLLLVGRFLLRQISGEQLVLPHRRFADVDHRCDRRGGRVGIESMAHDCVLPQQA